MRTLLLAIAACTLAGCSALPDIVHQPQIHNPFPQLSRVAVIPFANQSDDPTVDGDSVALAYYNELQQIPGFEVMPVGVAKIMEMQFARHIGRPPSSGEDFQQLAQFMDVDAVVVASVTEFSSYYPPRMGLAVRWYAANPGFHPIPAGYGLPWGTAEEEYIPESLVFQAEFELAKEQLKTQTPAQPPLELPPLQLPPQSRTPQPLLNPTMPRQTMPPQPMPPQPLPPAGDMAGSAQLRPASAQALRSPADEQSSSPAPSPATDSAEEILPRVAPQPRVVGNGLNGSNGFSGMPGGGPLSGIGPAPDLPAAWPDPRGFLPPPPTPFPAESLPQSSPVLSLTRLYHGNDAQFTEQLANYYYFRDDARFGGWQSYLQRSEDFIRFCCHLHVSELLAARGGAGKTRVVWRWPIGRYER